ncbi:MAG: peptidyl-tRNA hydrolase Pth2 [Candidatus Nezhaarchaeales archaeon]
MIVVRGDLKMSKGKLAVEVAHAAVSAAEEARLKARGWWERWMLTSQKKVVVKVSSEEELLRLEAEAKSLNIPCSLIRDAGLTELPPNTITTLGLGPAPEELLDRLTRMLTLL